MCKPIRLTYTPRLPSRIPDGNSIRDCTSLVSTGKISTRLVHAVVSTHAEDAQLQARQKNNEHPQPTRGSSSTRGALTRSGSTSTRRAYITISSASTRLICTPSIPGQACNVRVAQTRMLTAVQGRTSLYMTTSRPGLGLLISYSTYFNNKPRHASPHRPNSSDTDRKYTRSTRPGKTFLFTNKHSLGRYSPYRHVP